MKEKQLVTSVSLPEAEAGLWRANRAEIMQFSERYLRIKMRNKIRRAVTRKYNRAEEEFEIVTTRFAPTEYDTLHFVAHGPRMARAGDRHGCRLCRRSTEGECVALDLWTHPVVEKAVETSHPPLLFD